MSQAQVVHRELDKEVSVILLQANFWMLFSLSNTAMAGGPNFWRMSHSKDIIPTWFKYWQVHIKLLPVHLKEA